MYDRLVYIRSLIPDDSGLEQIEPFMAPLVAMSAFDLGQGRLSTFSSYRFLYERSEEHTFELQSLMRISYAVFCLKNKKTKQIQEKQYCNTNQQINTQKEKHTQH